MSKNFDVYNTGALTTQSPRWKLWDATSHDAVVEASAEGAGKVLRIQRTSTTAPDVVFPLGNRTTGRYRLSFNMFVAKGATGYYNVQHTDGGGANPNWAFQLEFQSNGFGRLFITSNRVIGAFYYKNGEWNDLPLAQVTTWQWPNDIRIEQVSINGRPMKQGDKIYFTPDYRAILLWFEYDCSFYALKYSCSLSENSN